MLRICTPLCWKFLAAAVLLLGIAACSQTPGSGNTDFTAQPLLGQFREPGGILMDFLPNGIYVATLAPPGHFTVDGTHIHFVRKDGKTFDGERLTADTLTVGPASPTLTLYRVGSAAAQTTAARTPPPVVAPAPAVAALPVIPVPLDPVVPELPQPDRSLPFNRYTALPDSPSDCQLDYMAAAFASRPWTKEEKYARFSPTHETDAFKLREAMPLALTPIEARIQGFAQQHYYTVSLETGPVIRTHPPHTYPLRWQIFSREDANYLVFKPYDFERKGFPLDGTLETGMLRADGSPGCRAKLRWRNVPRPTLEMFLPIADEGLARTLEALRAAAPKQGFAASGTLYFWVAGTSWDGTEQIEAVPVKMHLVLKTRDAKSLLAEFDLDL